MKPERMAPPARRALAPVLVAAVWLAPAASLAQEASSASYVMETSGMITAGGVSESDNYCVSDAVGLALAGGEMTSASFSAEVGIINKLDADGDGVSGAGDLCPTENSGCYDLDFDGCIDQPDVDADMDGVTAGACDCDDTDLAIWGTPGEALNLLLGGDDPAATTLSWEAPAEGGTQPRYDTIRSADPADFVTAAICVETDDVADTAAFDFGDPPPGGAFFYLVRAENGCADGRGPLGVSQGLYARAARDCS